MINCRWHANVDSERDWTDTSPSPSPRRVWLVGAAGSDVYGTREKATATAVQCVRNEVLKVRSPIGRRIVEKLLTDQMWDEAIWLFNHLVGTGNEITVSETTIR